MRRPHSVRWRSGATNRCKRAIFDPSARRFSAARRRPATRLSGPGFCASEQASLRRLDGYGGARGLASREIYERPAPPCESALQRRLPTQSAAATGRQGSPAAVPAYARRGPVTQQRATAVAVNRSTAPAPRPAPPDAAEEAPREDAWHASASRPRPPRERIYKSKTGWAPARPRPPAPASTPSTTC